MNLSDYKLIFVTIGMIGILLIASPVIATVISPVTGEQFSRLYILGPEHQAKNYPYSIQADQNYSVYIGLENHMRSSMYYVLYLKLRNQTDSMPSDTLATSSTLEPVYTYKFIVSDGATWETPLTFKLSNVSLSKNQTLVGSISVNGISFNINKPALLGININTNASAYYYQLFFELWAYNTQSGLVEYNNRHVDLQLNLTKTSM